MTYSRRLDVPPAPKPYAFVDLAPDAQVDRQRPLGHDALRSDRLTGRIDLELEALSPVHIASGLLVLTGEARRPLVRELVRVGGVPVVPGSSLKGCVRAIVEAISLSCIRVTRAREVPRELEGCRDKDRLCVACRIFGAQDFQGLVRFADMRLAGDPKRGVEVVEVPQFFQPRSREATYLGDRYVRGRKLYMHGTRQAVGDGPIEVCRAGSRLAGALDFANLSAAQLGLLLVGLGQDSAQPFALKLGGAKPACYGSIRVHIQRIALSGADRYLDWDAPEDVDGDAASYLDAARGLVLAPQLAAVAEVLRWPNERECPAGNY
jgi:CRISPR/Cas system CSM-associated protein Csm3 (group 7 of RAMP superfamily)